MKQVRCVLAVLLAVLVLHPAAASAGVLVHRDPAGDMARSAVGSNLYTPAPSQVDGDIVATRVVHARRAIWIQIRLRELETLGNGNFHLVSIGTRWRTRNVELDAFPGHWEGRTTTTDARGRIVSCEVTHRIDYERNRVMLRVPRACLGRPPWVQVAIRTTVAGALHVYADDGRSTGLGTGLRYGRRITLD